MPETDGVTSAREDATTGADLIAAERQRQIEEEGWTARADDQYGHAELTRAALSYAETACEQISPHFGGLAPDHLDLYTRTDWPWLSDWWKPSDDPIRNLVKAGALIAAEIDRLARRA